MARPLRLEFEGAVYHITSRGNEKREIFLDDKDRFGFIEILKEVIRKFNWLCHAYCLMNNHYHLLIETPEGNLAKGMRQLNGVYTQRFNKRHQRVGHLLQGRYKAILIDKESYLLEVARYVVLNPVRAKMVDKPHEWKWSSFKATAFARRPDSCLTVDWILSHFSEDRRTARREYVKFVMAGTGKESIWKDLKGQVLLGGEGFIERFLPILSKKEGFKEIPRKQRFLKRPELGKIFSERGIKDKKERNERIIEAVYRHGYSQSEVAGHLGIHYSTISKILKNSRFKT